MIGDTLNYIRLEIRDHLGMQDDDISLGHLHSPRVRSNYHGIRIALVNVTEEAVLRMAPHDLRRSDAQPGYAQSLLPLNLHVVIAFDFEDYQASLNLLSETYELFHAKPIFDEAAQRPTNPFPASLQRLVFNVQNCDLAELHHLWSVNGGALLPSLFYQVSMVRVSQW